MGSEIVSISEKFGSWELIEIFENYLLHIKNFIVKEDCACDSDVCDNIEI